MAAGGIMATRVVRHDSDAGAWVTATRLPHPRLRGLIHDYEGYVEQRLSFTRRMETPSLRVPLIIGFGPAFRVGWPDQGARTAAHRSFVAGMSDQYALVSADGLAACLEVQLSPIGMYLILGLPMHELTNRTVELREVLGPEADVVTERLNEARDWDKRFAMLDDLFLARLARARSLAAPVAHSWEELLRRGGRIDIATLAEEAGWSHKHLIDQFRAQIGLPPKMLARVLRFSRAVRRIDGAAPPSWPALAAECGYYDQAHLIRDFRRFAGSTPGDFLRRRIPGGGGVIGD